MIGNINKILQVTALFMVLSLSSFAQVKTEAVRLSGIVLDADSRMEVPYASIQISGTQYGTSSDNSGYFSLFMNPGDTLVFSSIGYQDAAFVMPFQLGSNSYSLIQLMKKDTLLLEEVVVFPWPTIENFEKAFLDTQPKQSEMEHVVEEVKRDLSNQVDATRQTDYYYDQMRYQKLYELHGTMPPNNFLNPMRWSNFIRDVKSGRLKQNEEEED